MKWLQNQPTAKPPKELGRHSFVTGLGHPDQLMLLGQDPGCSLEAWEGLGDLPEVTAIAQASYKGSELEKKGQNELPRRSTLPDSINRWTWGREMEGWDGFWVQGRETVHQERLGIPGSVPELESCCWVPGQQADRACRGQREAWHGTPLQRMEVEAIGEVTWEVNGDTEKKEKVPVEDQHPRGSHRDDEVQGLAFLCQLIRAVVLFLCFPLRNPRRANSAGSGFSFPLDLLPCFISVIGFCSHHSFQTAFLKATRGIPDH